MPHKKLTKAGRAGEAGREFRRGDRRSAEAGATQRRVRMIQAGAVLGGIVDEVKKVAASIAEISVAAQEQAKGINEINQAVTQWMR